MTKTVFWGGVAAALVVAFLALPSFSEDQPEAPAGGDPSHDFWAELGTTGPEHEWLAFMEGTFEAKAKFWMGPGEPMESAGKAVNTWVLGKHFIRTHYTADFAGTAFEGEGTLGFSNATKSWQALWLDNSSTHIQLDEGERDGDVVTVKGKTHTPFGDLPTRSVHTKLGPDAYMYEAYWMMPANMGGEMKVMEVRYKRIP